MDTHTVNESDKVKMIPEHLIGITCSYCGQQAVKVSGKINAEVPSQYSCGSMFCDLHNLYLENGELLSLISLAEEWLKIPPAKVLIAYTDNGNTCKAGFLVPGASGATVWSTIFTERGGNIHDMKNKLDTFELFLNSGREIIVRDGVENGKLN